MATRPVQEQQQSTPRRPPGAWELRACQALTLAPRQDGLLRVAQGRVWATFDGPPPPVGTRGGDLFVEAGQSLFVARGERVVMEPATRGEDVFFHWDVLPRTQAVPVARWQALAVPWRDLRGALGAAGVAAWRLVRALAGIAVAPRPQRWPGPRVPA